jgi:hypothetical protein
MAAAEAIIITGTITDMAIPNEVRGVRIAPPVYWLARTVVCLLGLGAVAWGGSLLPLFWQQAPPHRVASKILQGHTYKMQSLFDEVQQAAAAERSSFCNPTELHDTVILRISILDQATAAANQTLIDSAYGPSYEASRKALSCMPADPFVWLTLFWLDASKHGFEPASANYLRLSYALGPNEAWIALWRSRLAFALFDRLPADLADDAIDEFVKLVDTGTLYPETAAIFAAASPIAQSRIDEHLKTAKAIPRQLFARALSDRGLYVNIPGVDTTPARPWQ